MVYDGQVGSASDACYWDEVNVCEVRVVCPEILDVDVSCSRDQWDFPDELWFVVDVGVLGVLWGVDEVCQ